MDTSLDVADLVAPPSPLAGAGVAAPPPSRTRAYVTDMYPGLIDSDVEGYPPILDVFVGMKCLITENIDVKHGLANGSTVEVVDIRFDDDVTFSVEQEQRIDGHTLVHIVSFRVPSKPPVCILVKVDSPRFPQLAGLPIGVYPIFFPEKSSSVKVKSLKTTLSIRQFCLIPALYLTIHKIQGRTCPSLVLILPPRRGERGAVLPFGALYVILSRCRRLDDFRTLSHIRTDMYNTIAIPADIAAELAHIYELERRSFPIPLQGDPSPPVSTAAAAVAATPTVMIAPVPPAAAEAPEAVVAVVVSPPVVMAAPVATVATTTASALRESAAGPIIIQRETRSQTRARAHTETLGGAGPVRMSSRTTSVQRRPAPEMPVESLPRNKQSRNQSGLR
jgi:hypothetical protein